MTRRVETSPVDFSNSWPRDPSVKRGVRLISDSLLSKHLKRKSVSMKNFFLWKTTCDVSTENIPHRNSAFSISALKSFNSYILNRLMALWHNNSLRSRIKHVKCQSCWFQKGRGGSSVASSKGILTFVSEQSPLCECVTLKWLQITCNPIEAHYSPGSKTHFKLLTCSWEYSHSPLCI